MGIRELYLPWMETAKSLIGTKEIPGARSNPVIIEWAQTINPWVKKFYTNDDIPWCGLFVAHCMMDNNIQIEFQNPLSALEWAKFGKKVEPCYGAVLVFYRDGGGHVGFAVGEDANYYHVLGGNQSNMVNVTRVAKSRLRSIRWPSDYLDLYDAAPDLGNAFTGAGISYNEA